MVSKARRLPFLQRARRALRRKTPLKLANGDEKQMTAEEVGDVLFRGLELSLGVMWPFFWIFPGLDIGLLDGRILWVSGQSLFCERVLSMLNSTAKFIQFLMGGFIFAFFTLVQSSQHFDLQNNQVAFTFTLDFYCFLKKGVIFY